MNHFSGKIEEFVQKLSAGTYPLAMRDNSRLLLTVNIKTCLAFHPTPLFPCCHLCFGCPSGVLEAAILFISDISSPDTIGKRAWCTAIVPVCFVEQNEDFHRRKYCPVVFQSGGCLPPFAVVAKR